MFFISNLRQDGQQRPETEIDKITSFSPSLLHITATTTYRAEHILQSSIRSKSTCEWFYVNDRVELRRRKCVCVGKCKRKSPGRNPPFILYFVVCVYTSCISLHHLLCMDVACLQNF